MINHGYEKQMRAEETGKKNHDASGTEDDPLPIEAHDETEMTDTSAEPETSARVAELEALIAQAKDQLLRKAAEFDNYKKRTEAETVAVIRFANEDLLLRLLPVLDDFERSFKALRKTSAGTDGNADGPPSAGDRATDAFISGIDLIYGKFRKVLEQAGLTPFESAGQPFDPELHDALLQVPRDDVPHHTVVEEIERGYRLDDKGVRHARVIVSSKNDPARS